MNALDVEQAIVDALSAQIIKEIDEEIVGTLITESKTHCDHCGCHCDTKHSRVNVHRNGKHLLFCYVCASVVDLTSI